MKAWLGLGAALVIVCACGGKAIIDGKAGSGGAGGTTASSTGSSTATQGGSLPGQTGSVTFASAAVGGTGGGSVGPGGCGTAMCQQACVELYNCGLAKDANGKQLCPGFVANALKQQQFLCGGTANVPQGCGPTCDQQPALPGFINPNDCKMTVDFISNASADFAKWCKNGF